MPLSAPAAAVKKPSSEGFFMLALFPFMKLSSADHGYSCLIRILRTYLRRLNSPSHRLTENCIMNKFLLTLALIAPLANAAEIVGTTEDNRAGEVFGSGVGVLLGGAAGGPIGALVGAGIGYFGGQKTQQGLGQTGTAYLVQDDQGQIREVRRNRLPTQLRAEVAQLDSRH